MTASATHRTRHPLALRLQCRKEWVEGQGTLAEVATKHSVPSQTLIAWYRREKWTEARNRWREKQLSDNGAPVQPPPCGANPKNSADDTHARKAARLDTQLDSLDNAIDNAKTADDWQKLSTARQRLFEQWRILKGIPLPGSRRQPKEKAKPMSSESFQPEE